MALAWVLKSPVVFAPIVGATKPHHLPEAIAALDLRLAEEEIQSLEEPYTPHWPSWFWLTVHRRIGGRPVGPDLRIMWPTPLPFCAQVHGQVDESEGRGRDDGRPPIPATSRHGGHNQSGGYQDLRAGEPESPPRGKPRSHSVSVFVGEQREFRAPGSRRRSVHASSGPGLCPLHTANRCRRPSGRSNCYTVRYWHRMLSRIAVGSDHGKLKSDRWSRQYRNKG